jgi:hypothetical protein
VNRKALEGWAITRIPPMTAPYGWSIRKDALNLISVSNVVLEEDFVECARHDTSGGWTAPLKL